MTSYKLSTIIVTSLLTQKYTKNQQQPQTGASSANTLLRTWQRKNSNPTKSAHTDYRSTVYYYQQQYNSATYNSKIEIHYRSQIPTMIIDIMVLSRINTIKRIKQQKINYTHTHSHTHTHTHTHTLSHSHTHTTPPGKRLVANNFPHVML